MTDMLDDCDFDEQDDTCQECGGDGGFHDCGEDSCCCRYSHGEEQDYDWFDCPTCGGTGFC